MTERELVAEVCRRYAVRGANFSRIAADLGIGNRRARAILVASGFTIKPRRHQKRPHQKP